jgi:mannose-6-phosphate isomerase-like protein (cupin superfamily)
MQSRLNKLGVRRYDEIAHTNLEARKTTFHSKNIEIQLLTQESSKKKITPLLLTLQPGSQTQTERQERGVEKFLYVLEGEVRIKVDKEEFQLKSGETLYFDASLSHQITNEKQKAARLLFAVSPSKI